VLNVRVNLLGGPAGTVQRCAKLVQLNLADNAFTGPLVRWMTCVTFCSFWKGSSLHVTAWCGSTWLTLHSQGHW
jgi:hypothetical protein